MYVIINDLRECDVINKTIYLNLQFLTAYKRTTKKSQFIF